MFIDSDVPLVGSSHIPKVSYPIRKGEYVNQLVQNAKRNLQGTMSKYS